MDGSRTLGFFGPLGGSWVVTDSEGTRPSAEISAAPMSSERMRGLRAGTELRELGSRLGTLALILINTAVDLVF
jgi:hypothetical protein